MKIVNRKSTYTSPEVELLVLRYEEGVLAGSDPNAIQSNSASSGYDSSYDLGEI